MQRLVGRPFCSDVHKQEYFGEINHMAVLRLRDAGDRRRHYPESDAGSRSSMKKAEGRGQEEYAALQSE